MEHLIARYLFQNKYCPLPGIGKLALSERPAVVSHGAQLIEPPQPVITLVHGEFPEDDFLAFISFAEKIDTMQASAGLQRFCHQLLGLDSYAEAKIPSTGKFYVNAEGNLVFKQSSFPAIYLDSIVAEKVIHPDASHTLLVGDKESSTTLMTEYFNVEDPAPRKRWWIAAVVLAIAALIVIFFYFSNEDNTRMFGNAAKSDPPEATRTYTTPK